MNTSPAIKPPPCLTLGDSGVIALKAVQSILQGRQFDPFPQPWPVRLAVRLLNRMPLRVRIAAADMISKSIGHPESKFQQIDMNSAARWVTDGYPAKNYPGIVIGAPGLASTFLCSLTGFPFLPQHMLFNARRDMAYDDAQAYLDAGREIAGQFVKNNPGVEATIHFDPVHDRFLIGRVVFIRAKYLELPPAYRDFIRQKLIPGAPVILLDCRYQWSRARVDKRIFYQLGGLGGFSDRDYIDEIPKLVDYRNRWGGTGKATWKIDLEYSKGPESEWGSTGEFLDQAEDFTAKIGNKRIRFIHNHPIELSRNVFRIYRECYDGPGKPRNVYTGVFTHTEPGFPALTGALPLWLPFITSENLHHADDILSEWRKNENISGRKGTAYITLHPSFCAPPDIVGIPQWRSLFEKYFENVYFPGVDSSRYPFDLGSYVNIFPEISSIARQNSFHGRPFRTPSTSELIRFFKN